MILSHLLTFKSPHSFWIFLDSTQQFLQLPPFAFLAGKQACQFVGFFMELYQFFLLAL